jgi:acetyl-CoA C-acetyltransferase
MTAQEAERWGLVNRISAPGDALGEARALAAEIASVSPTSVRLTMQIVHEGDQEPDDIKASAATLHSTAIDDLSISEDMVEGLSAFAQKRQPVWKNR